MAVLGALLGSMSIRRSQMDGFQLTKLR